MKRITPLSIALITSGLSVAVPVSAFEPPHTGAPSERIGAGTRKFEEKKTAPAAIEPPAAMPAEGAMPETAQPMAQMIMAESAQLLATEKTAFTASSAPTLYWYIANSVPYPVEITVQTKGKILLKKDLGIINTSGMQSIRLSDYGVQLKAGKDYTWSVAFIVDPQQHQQDLVSHARIRYQKPAKAFTDTKQMLQAGYWYDAIAQLVESHSPDLNNVLQQQGIQLQPKQNQP